MTTSSFENAVPSEQVSLNFCDSYRYQKNHQRLEEKVHSANNRNQEQSKRLGELAITTTKPEILEDRRILGQDVYKLSSTYMLNQFEQDFF